MRTIILLLLACVSFGATTSTPVKVKKAEVSVLSAEETKLSHEKEAALRAEAKAYFDARKPIHAQIDAIRAKDPQAQIPAHLTDATGKLMRQYHNALAAAGDERDRRTGAAHKK